MRRAVAASPIPLVVAFFTGWVFMYADRAALSPVLGMLGEEFQVGATQLGLVASVFYFSYAAFQIPFGLAAETVGRKRLLVAGFALFGLTTLLAGLAWAFAVLLALGFLTGVGQATYYPTQYSIAAEALPARHRAAYLSVINSGMAVGIGGGTAFAAFLAFRLDLGWRLALVVMGGLTILTAALLHGLVSEPQRTMTGREAPRVGLRAVLGREQLAAYVAGFCSLYGFFVVLTWLPYYLETERGYSSLDAGYASTLAVWPAIPAAVVAALLSDRLSDRRRLLYVMMPAAGLVLATLPLAATRAQIAGVLLCYGVVGKLAVDPLLVAYLADNNEPRAYSAAFSVFNFAGMASSVVAPLVTGLIGELTGTMNAGFYLSASLLVLGAVVLGALGEPPPRAPPEGSIRRR